MPSLKDLRNRIASVKATQKITKAMQMVAAAKLRRAQEAATAARPYAQRMDKVLANLAGRVHDPPHLDPEAYAIGEGAAERIGQRAHAVAQADHRRQDGLAGAGAPPPLTDRSPHAERHAPVLALELAESGHAGLGAQPARVAAVQSGHERLDDYARELAPVSPRHERAETLVAAQRSARDERLEPRPRLARERQQRRPQQREHGGRGRTGENVGHDDEPVAGREMDAARAGAADADRGPGRRRRATARGRAADAGRLPRRDAGGVCGGLTLSVPRCSR